MTKKIQFQVFEDIWRGTSVSIPIKIQRLDLTPFDLTDYKIYFTMKKFEWDWDYDDVRAEVHKEILISEPETGKFFIQLSSRDTFYEPGTYYFDITMMRNNAITRIAAFTFQLVGGVSNANVNPDISPIIFTDEITINFFNQTSPIVITAPLISDPPENLIETIITSPSYLLEELDDPAQPIRNIKIHSYAPQVSFAMNFTDLHDGLEHSYAFERFAFHTLPDTCPFHNALLKIKDREILFDIGTEMSMDIYDSYIQSSPEIIVGGKHTHQSSLISYSVGDNVIHGSLNIMLYFNEKHYCHVTGNYVMPDTPHVPSNWTLKIDYFNWEI